MKNTNIVMSQSSTNSATKQTQNASPDVGEDIYNFLQTASFGERAKQMNKLLEAAEEGVVKVQTAVDAKMSDICDKVVAAMNKLEQLENAITKAEKRLDAMNSKINSAKAKK